MKDPKIRASLVWGATPAGTTHAISLEPGTKEFFDTALQKRIITEFSWLAELVPFSETKGKKVLEVGCGVGFDAFEFCRAGADYYGIDITPENIERTRKHLGFYGYTPTVFEGDAENLKFPNDNFDVVFSNGVLHHVPDINKSFQEIYRVLKPGGTSWIIVYHKNSIFYWITLFLRDHICGRGFLKRSFKERLSMIEYTTSEEKPLVNVYSRYNLKRLLRKTGFEVELLSVRKLNKEDFPFGLESILWRFIPQKTIDNLSKKFGWFIIAKVKVTK